MAQYGPSRNSEHAEEWIVRDFFGGQRGGTFVDVGSYHYRTFSNTYYLEQTLGWSGLAIDAKNRRLFSVCSNRVMAISDPDTGKVVATPAIGAGSDGAAFDQGTGYAFSSNGDGTMTVVAQTSGKWDVLENIATERGARTIAVDEKTHKVYSPTAKTAPSTAPMPFSGSAGSRKPKLRCAGRSS